MCLTFGSCFQHPVLPEFESDDLKRLGKEITQARLYLSQARTYREMYDVMKTGREDHGELNFSRECNYKATTGIGSRTI